MVPDSQWININQKLCTELNCFLFLLLLKKLQIDGIVESFRLSQTKHKKADTVSNLWLKTEEGIIYIECWSRQLATTLAISSKTA